jgi:hypothetical protein
MYVKYELTIFKKWVSENNLLLLTSQKYYK